MSLYWKAGFASRDNPSLLPSPTRAPCGCPGSTRAGPITLELSGGPCLADAFISESGEWLSLGEEGLIFHTSVCSELRNAIINALFGLFLWSAFSTLVISFFCMAKLFVLHFK